MKKNKYPTMESILSSYDTFRRVKNHPNKNSWGIIHFKKDFIEEFCLELADFAWFETRSEMIDYISDLLRYDYPELGGVNPEEEMVIFKTIESETQTLIDRYKDQIISDKEFANIFNKNKNCDRTICALGHFTDGITKGGFDLIGKQNNINDFLKEITELL